MEEVNVEDAVPSHWRTLSAGEADKDLGINGIMRRTVTRRLAISYQTFSEPDRASTLANFLPADQ